MYFVTTFIKTSSVLSILLALSACQTIPSGLDHGNQDQDQQFQRLVTDSSLNNSLEPIWYAGIDVTPPAILSAEVIIQVGDLLRIGSRQFPELDGLHQIVDGGRIELPYLADIELSGLTRSEARTRLALHLLTAGWSQQKWIDLDLTVVEQAPISVSVQGAVFSPGRVILNSKPAAKPTESIRQLSGSMSAGRNLLEALRSAGGVRPDADLSRVVMIRDKKRYEFDLQGVINGDVDSDVPMLINSDRVLVKSTGSEQHDLIRPSAITPPGMRVFMSNLTAPALSNAQSAIGNDASRVPYGVSLIDVAVSANCVGGTHMANASRSVILITRNYGATRQLVIHREINDLLQASSDPLVNPFVMPNDGIACYDSRFTNFRDVARGLGELINPFILGKLL